MNQFSSQSLLNSLDESLGRIRKNRIARIVQNPFKYIQLTILKKFPTVLPTGVVRNIKTFWGGTMSILLPSASDLYLRGLKADDSEVRLTRFMIRTVERGTTVVDIGTHFGFYSLLLSILVGKSGKVFGFEPSPRTFGVFQSNIKTHSNIVAVNIAIGETDIKSVLHEYSVRDSESNSIKFGETGINVGKFVVGNTIVNVKPFDDIVEELSIIPNFIKIDAEGAEVEVLKGMLNTLKKFNPVIAMEYLDESYQVDVYESASMLLYGIGYRSHVVLEDGSVEPTSDIEKSMSDRRIRSDNIIFIK